MPHSAAPADRAAAAYRDAAEALAQYATTAAHAAGQPDRVTAGRGLRAYAMDVLDAAVVADRLAGDPWPDIAARYGFLSEESLVARYAPIVARFEAGEEQPWRPEAGGVLVPLPGQPARR